MKILDFCINVAEYLLVIFIILNGSSMYSAMQIGGITSNAFFIKCSALMALAIIALYCFKRTKFHVRSSNLTIILLFVVHNLFYILITHYNVTKYLANYMFVLYAFVALCIVLRNTGNYYRIIEKYCNVTIVIALLSLFFYVFGTTLHLLPGNSTISYTKMNIWFTCKTYYGLYFEAQTQNLFGMTFIRNCGIFMEAPGFAFPLSMALIYELFKQHKPRKWVCIVLVVAGLTSISTKVIITTAIIFILRYLSNSGDKKSIVKIIKILVAPVIILVGGTVIYIILMSKVEENASSFLGRMDSLQACIKVWLDHPLFGSGFRNDDSIREYYTYIVSNYNGITAGLFCVLAQGGIWIMLQYVYALINLYKNTKNENIKLVRVFLIIFLIYWFQSSMQFSAVMLLVLAMGIVTPLPKNKTVLELLHSFFNNYKMMKFCKSIKSK